jgi:hypothetical protein
MGEIAMSDADILSLIDNALPEAGVDAMRWTPDPNAATESLPEPFDMPGVLDILRAFAHLNRATDPPRRPWNIFEILDATDPDDPTAFSTVGFYGYPVTDEVYRRALRHIVEAADVAEEDFSPSTLPGISTLTTTNSTTLPPRSRPR